MRNSAGWHGDRRAENLSPSCASSFHCHRDDHFRRPYRIAQDRYGIAITKSAPTRMKWARAATKAETKFAMDLSEESLARQASPPLILDNDWLAWLLGEWANGGRRVASCMIFRESP
jgi:hypothetical protein